MYLDGRGEAERHVQPVCARALRRVLHYERAVALVDHFGREVRVGGAALVLQLLGRRRALEGAALLVAAAISAIAAPAGWLICLVAAGAGAVLIAWFARRNLGGYTGDVLGAGQQVAELFALTMIAMLNVNNMKNVVGSIVPTGSQLPWLEEYLPTRATRAVFKGLRLVLACVGEFRCAEEFVYALYQTEEDSHWFPTVSATSAKWATVRGTS